MKRRVLLPSLLIVVLCMGLIVGATFALFGKSSEVDVVVKSGKVEMVSAIEEESLKLYSLKQVSLDENAVDEYELQTEKFINGGTAVIDGDSLIINNISPGDKVEFVISIKNYSTITAQYRTKVDYEGDNALNSALVANFEGAPSAWKTVEPEEDPANPEAMLVHVSIELPKTAGDEVSGLSTTLTFTVEAVQGNADVPALVSTADDLLAALNDESVHSIELSAGEYEIFENEPSASFYGIEIDHPVTLVGAGMNETVIKIGDGKKAISGQAYFYIKSDDVTISDLTIESAQTGVSTSELFDLVKVSMPDGAANVTFDTVAFTGTTNNYLNLHNTDNVTIANCVIGDANGAAYKCAVAIAASSNVQISDTSIVGGAWGSVGLMHDPNDSEEYPHGSDVAFINCDIASFVYTEHTETDKIHTVTGLEDWSLVKNVPTDDPDILKDIYINPVVTVNTSEELAIALATPQISEIYVKEGSYELSQQVVINRDLKLYGAGSDKTVIQTTNTALERYIIADAEGGIDLEISGIHFMGPDKPVHNAGNILVVGGVNVNTNGTVSIDSCMFTQFTKGGIVIKGGSATITNNLIETIPFKGAEANGIQIDMEAQAVITGNTIRVQETEESEGTSTGILVLKGGNVTELSGNTFDKCELAINVTDFYDATKTSKVDDEYAVKNTFNGSTVADYYYGEGKKARTMDQLKKYLVDTANEATLIILRADLEWDRVLTVKAGDTLLGNGYTITITEDAVKATGGNVSYCFEVNGTVDGVCFNLTYDVPNTPTLAILGVKSDAIIRNCTFKGSYAMGDNEVTRGIVGFAGAENILIEKNEFYSLRQPAYLSGGVNNKVIKNIVDETRGFVVEGDGWTFTGNTFKNTSKGDQGVCDICFLNTTTQLSEEKYCEISTSNGDCYVQDQHGKSQSDWTDYKNGAKV